MGTPPDSYEDPAESGEVEARIHVVLASTRVTVVGEDLGGDVTVASDLFGLLMAVTEEGRMVVLFDARAPAVDIDLFGRIARDFPTHIAILVRGGGEETRARLFAAGVYRARCYSPAPNAPCDAHDEPLVLEVSSVLESVRRRLEVPRTIPVGALG